MRAGFEKNELLLKMLPKLFFFRILVFFYFWGIRNRELILDWFFWDCSHQNLYRKMKQTNFIWKKKNWGVVKWLRFQKSDPRLILFTKILIRFFLSLKHPHALTFFFTFFESFFSWQKNFRKKEQPKFLYETLYV